MRSVPNSCSAVRPATATLCSCTHSPGMMGAFAMPMTLPNFRIGVPTGIGATAILWPRGILLTAVTPKADCPIGRRSIATTMLSAGSSRRSRGSSGTMGLWMAAVDMSVDAFDRMFPASTEMRLCRSGSEGCDGLQGPVKHLPLLVFQRCFAQTPQPVCRIRPSLDHRQCRKHAVIFGQSARMGIAVALDQAPAVEDLDGQRVIGIVARKRQIGTPLWLRRVDPLDPHRTATACPS